MKAIVLGATGAVGKDLVKQLTADERFGEVHIFVRREPRDIGSTKVKVHVVDFNKPEQWQDEVRGDVAFSCMGTTLKAAGSKEAQRMVDYTYQLRFAQAAAQNGVPTYILVSAYMANAQSGMFYTRIKGELEESVNELPFQQITILRPPVLIRQNSKKTDERIMVAVLKSLNALGLMRKHRPMPTQVVARCMVNAATNGTKGVLEAKDIWAKGE